MTVQAASLPILACSGCQAPVRYATATEAVWSRKYGGWPDPADECLWCGPKRRAVLGSGRLRSRALVGPVRPVLVAGRLVLLTRRQADELMRAISRVAFDREPSPLEEECYSAGWDAGEDATRRDYADYVMFRDGD